MPFIPEIQRGELVDLIPAVPLDAPLIFAAWEPTVTSRGWHHQKPATVELEQAYLQANADSQKDCLFLIVRKIDIAVIGTIGLHVHIDKPKQIARLGLLIFQTECVGSKAEAEAVMLAVHQAFDRMKTLVAIYANIDTDDAHEQELFTRLGFIEACPGRHTELPLPDDQSRENHEGRKVRKVWRFEIRPEMLIPKTDN